MNRNTSLGLIFAGGAYIFWGIVPVYFKMLSNVKPLEVLSHRVIWSVLVLAIIILFQGKFLATFSCLKNKRILFSSIISATLISINWCGFIYAVSTDRILEASFGYFMTPLLMIALGMFVLKEKMSLVRLVSVCFAILGVLYQLIELQVLPWLSLMLGLSFSLYGLMRKKSELNPISGLFLETLFVSIFAIPYLIWLNQYDQLTFLHQSIRFDILLITLGLVTTVPLIFFVYGAKLLDYSIVGFVQYIAPSLQLTVAVLIFNEALSLPKLISFCLVWCGLFILVFGKQAISLKKWFLVHKIFV